MPNDSNIGNNLYYRCGYAMGVGGCGAHRVRPRRGDTVRRRPVRAGADQSRACTAMLAPATTRPSASRTGAAIERGRKVVSHNVANALGTKVTRPARTEGPGP
jgi:hypothetical protein